MTGSKSGHLPLICLGQICLGLCFVFGSTAAHAVPKFVPGKLVEKVPSTADVTVTPTTLLGIPLPFGGWPQTQHATKNSPAVFNIPRFVFLGPIPFPVLDARQSAVVTGDPGQIADLSIESFQFDPITSQFTLNNIFSTITQRLGYGVEFPIPDLFADTNGDGHIGAGDVLYSLVNLDTYLNAIPPVSFGTSYQVLAGTVAGLPGMEFSTTPFSFDPSSGFTGTAYTGPAVTEAIHLPSSVPEPTSLSLFGFMLLGLFRYGATRSRS